MRSTSRWWIASALAAASVTAACTPADEEGPRPGLRAAPHPRGEIVVVVVGAAATLDPYGRRATLLTEAIVRPVYRSLYRMDPGGVPVADLVADLESDGEVATVTLEAGGLRARDVVASARRARPPSGFAGLRVRALGPRRIRLSGHRGDWPERLAVGTWVLPGGEATGNGGGPYRIARHRRGFETILEARPAAAIPPRAALVRVRSAPDTATALRLLEEGRAQVGWLPSTVNLDARASRAGLEYRGTLGWEIVALDFTATSLPAAARRWITRRTGRRSLAAGLVRDAGEVAAAPVPAGPEIAPASVVLAAPAEDELLTLLARALQRRLAAGGTAGEAVVIPAGDVAPPETVRLVRSLGAPGRSGGDFPRRWALFRVESALVWRPGVSGPDPNPTAEGPLWNVETWRVRGRI